MERLIFARQLGMHTARVLVLCLVLGFLGVSSVECTPLVQDASGSTPAVSSPLPPEAGRLLHRYLAPEAYGANPQNWDAAQDTSGVLYVGNTDGVLVYDGRGWRTLPVNNRSKVRSVAADGAGRVFVGAGQEIGVVRTDSVGRAHYESLLDHVPEEHRSFSDVWRTVVGPDGVYFQSHRRLFLWVPETKTLRAWRPPPESRFRSLNVVDGAPMVFVRGGETEGLMTIEADSLQLVPGGEAFADRAVKFVVPHDEHGLLVGTLDGVFVREGRSFRPFSTGADEVLSEAWVYKGTRLPNGTIAIATIDRGLWLLEQNGTVRRHLAVRDEPVTGLYTDHEGGLWALLDGGMLRYDLSAPVTEYDASTGLGGRVVDIVRHRDVLYAATNQSAYRLRTPEDTLAFFERVPGLTQGTSQIECYTLLSAGEDLLLGTAHGLARLDADGSVEYVFDQMPVYDLVRSHVHPSRFYAATENGVSLVRQTKEGWREGGYVSGLAVKPWSLVETNDGTLWVGTEFSGVYRARGLATPDSAVVDSFGTEHNLPPGEVAPYRWRGDVVFGTSTGVMRFSGSPEPRFESITLSPVPSAEGEGVVSLQTDEQGRTWGRTRSGLSRWRRHDSTWTRDPGPLDRFRDAQVSAVEMEGGGRVIWFGTWDNRLVRYVPGNGPSRPSVSTRIREVALPDRDSLLALDGGKAASPKLSYAENNVRVSYAASSLVRPDGIAYQYRLENRRGGWSSWGGNTEQVYGNLAPGRYTFAVRARLVYGDTTEAARYAFTIRPPWYRTWWAYALYLLAAVGVVVGAVRWRTWQLRRRQQALEDTVAQRTWEIEQQKERLADQAERLEELDEAKSRFFANVSHEFRTPLTLIRGPVRAVRERMQKGRLDPEEDARQLSLVDRNAGRLLRLVDQILGIARLEAGTYELDARPTDLGHEVRRIGRTFEPLAERERLRLTVEVEDVPDEAPPVYVDRRALEHILSNLISNAIKFTPAGGTITVSVCERDDAVTVAVADTGPGIPDDQQDAIFDRFAQVDDSSTRSQEGAGIGLAFAADLVDLHGGSIDLDSTVEVGTTVNVRFRRGTHSLSDGQLADGPASDGETAGQREEGLATGDDPGLPPEAPLRPTPSPESASSDAQSNPSDEPLDDKLVLVVDDNGEVREYVRSILEPDFSVIEALNGEDGLAVARQRLPDVILADVMMPEVDGHEMTRRLKDASETATIPVIMVTARAGTDEEVTGLQLGADDYVTKPFDADVLRQRVEGVVALQERLRRRLHEQIQADGVRSTEDPETPQCSEVEQHAREVIGEHLTDPDFGVDELARQMAASRSALYRRFDDETNTTPAALLTEMRMEKACELLRDGEGTVTQVAYAVGYNTLSSFSRAFRQHVGASPSTVAAAESQD